MNNLPRLLNKLKNHIFVICAVKDPSGVPSRFFI